MFVVHVYRNVCCTCVKWCLKMFAYMQIYDRTSTLLSLVSITELLLFSLIPVNTDKTNIFKQLKQFSFKPGMECLLH